MRRRLIKNPSAEADQFRRRALLAFVGVLVGLIALGGWYFKLQVVDYTAYATLSAKNRVKERPVVPGRGQVQDRQGRVLADNFPAFRLEVVPEEAGDPATWLPALRGIVELAPEDVARFHEERKVTRGFRPLILKPRVDELEAARFAVERWRFPGVELVAYLNRRYPHQDLFAHVIGYVGRIDVDDKQAMGALSSVFNHVGKTGLERFYEDLLRGDPGQRQVETNAEGRALRSIGSEPAMPGADLRLSIDLDLQQ